MPLGQIILTIVMTLLVMGWFFLRYRSRIARYRSLNMAFLRVTIARKDSDVDEKKETVKDFREQISIMEQLFASLKSLYSGTFSSWLSGQEYLSFEYVAHENEILFYVVVPKKSRLLVEKQIIGFYPDCLIEETNEVNIFSDRDAVAGEIMRLKK